MMMRTVLNNKIGRTFLRYGAVLSVSLLMILGFGSSSFAREVNYSGKEVPVYVTPGEPTQITFPDKIGGGFKRKQSALALERQGNFLVVFAQPIIPYEGEALLVHLKDKRSFALRILPADDDNPRDEFINLQDLREDDMEYGSNDEPRPEFVTADPSTIPGFVKWMVLTAEFGKRGGIPGYRRSNRYTGETILHDGTIEAKIDEIFMGTNYWGYVISVENLLDSSYKLNPATFRLDGTRAISAASWELAPRPTTAEQKIAKGHTSKVYIVTRSLRR